MDDDAKSVPGIQHSDGADLGTEMARIGGDVAQHVGRSAEQDGLDHTLWREIMVSESCSALRIRREFSLMAIRVRSCFSAKLADMGVRRAVRLAKPEQLMVLFVDPQNPLWRRLWEGKHINQNAINLMCDVASNTVQSWRSGGTMDPNTADKIFGNVEASLIDPSTLEIKKGKYKVKNVRLRAVENAEADQILEVITEYKRLFHNVWGDRKASGVKKQASKILKMDIDICRKIIDEAMFENLPMFPGMYFLRDSKVSNASAERHLKDYQGSYKAWFVRGKRLLLSTIRVRYIVGIEKGLLIRCKMYFPNVTNKSGVYEYDGYVIPRATHIFWLFEQRGEDSNDYIQFVTCKHTNFNGVYCMLGTYLTVGQGDKRAIAFGDIFLQRESGEDYSNDNLEVQLAKFPGDVTGDERTNILTIIQKFEENKSLEDAEYLTE